MEGDKTELEEQKGQLERDRHLLVEAAKKLDREVGVVYRPRILTPPT